MLFFLPLNVNLLPCHKSMIKAVESVTGLMGLEMRH